MPQRGDNPNEVLFIPGSKWAYHNVDNFYDVDSSLQQPVDEILSRLEEQFECPLAYLEFRRKAETPTHQHIYTTQQQPPQHMPSYDERIKRNTERARLEEFHYHEKEFA